MRCCAICASDIADGEQPRMAPIGRNDALVLVCDDCFDEPAREKVGPERNYDIPEGMSMAEMQRKISRIIGPNVTRPFNRNECTRAAQPGFIVVRVARKDQRGRTRDQNEAYRTLMGKRWAKGVRYLGVDDRYHLFERPDPKLVRDSRMSSSTAANPLAAIEKYRVK